MSRVIGFSHPTTSRGTPIRISPTDDDRPTLFDQGFEGPMPGHEPGMSIHYDLHASVWQHNPVGMFAAWNPSGSCGDRPDSSFVVTAPGSSRSVTPRASIVVWIDELRSLV